eukprot:6041950-Prymnesium_polylepis.2
MSRCGSNASLMSVVGMLELAVSAFGCVGRYTPFWRGIWPRARLVLFYCFSKCFKTANIERFESF